MPAHAQYSEGSDLFENSAFSLKGFGTLGIARSTNSDAELLRDVSQPKGISNHWSARNDSALGVQAGYRFSDVSEVVIQGVSHLGDDGSYKPQLTWAFLKYDITPRFSMRLGRVGTEFLMQADSRMVGYSYLPVRPAIDFYGIVPINSGDGIDASLRWPVGDGIVRIEGFAGVATENLPPYDLEGSKILKGSIGYDEGRWQFRYIYAQAKLSENIERVEPLLATLTMLGATNAARKLEFEDTVSQYQSIGAAYDDGTWQVQGAINYIHHETDLMENSRAANLLIGRRLGNISPYLGYTWAKSSGKTVETGLPNPMFASINSAIASAMAGSHIDRKTISVGARWDFTRNMDLKAQVDFVRGSKSSKLLLEDIDSDWDGKTTVFSLSLDFVF